MSTKDGLLKAAIIDALDRQRVASIVGENGLTVRQIIEESIRALAAQEQKSEGLVSVPREPSEEVIYAMVSAMTMASGYQYPKNLVRAAYKAALSIAAPPTERTAVSESPDMHGRTLEQFADMLFERAPQVVSANKADGALMAQAGNVIQWLAKKLAAHPTERTTAQSHPGDHSSGCSEMGVKTPAPAVPPAPMPKEPTGAEWRIERIWQYAEQLRSHAEALRHDIDAYRGALGYSVRGDHDGKLTDDTIPVNGIAEALQRDFTNTCEALRAAEAELAATSCPIGPNQTPGLCSAGTCYKCVVRELAVLRPVVEAAPMQPIITDPHGIIRFKENRIVSAFLDKAREAKILDLNMIACMDFTDEERQQFVQLIGYSISGYGELSYVSDESYDRASAHADLDKRDGK